MNQNSRMIQERSPRMRTLTRKLSMRQFHFLSICIYEGLRKVENCRSGRTVARALLARFNISSLLSSCTLAETRYPLPWKISIDPTKPRRKSIARRTARGNFLRKKKERRKRKKDMLSATEKRQERKRENICLC